MIYGKDCSAYENDAAHLKDEEKYMDEWRIHGPIGVLFNVLRLSARLKLDNY